MEISVSSDAENQLLFFLLIYLYPNYAVWVHDYHLLLVPGMVREQLPKARIGLFIHAPFPSSEIFRCLPSKSRKDGRHLLLQDSLINFFDT